MFAYYLKMFAQFFYDMRRQKLRCLLTMSGITWGTMSVILLMALGESFRQVSYNSMTGMGTNIVIMGGNRTTMQYKGMPPGRYVQMRDETIDLMQTSIPEIGEISPEIERWVTFSIGQLRQEYRCVGVYPRYGIFRNLPPRKGGRFIDPLDMENRRRVIFLGGEVSKKFFPGETDPVGKTIMMNGVPFTVIGVMKDKVQNSSYMSRDTSITFIPYSTARDIFAVTTVNRIILRARTDEETAAMKEKIYKVLGDALGFSPEDKDALWMWDTTEMTKFLRYFFMGFQGFLLLGGVCTLIVGGIGVANIMYVTIRERRREIGIKSALGATPGLILSQFMIESFMIMLIGGGIGVVGSGMILTVMSSPALAGMQKFMGKPMIDMTIALTTVAILTLIGFAAGWSPAKTASEMDPVRALEF